MLRKYTFMEPKGPFKWNTINAAQKTQICQGSEKNKPPYAKSIILAAMSNSLKNKRAETVLISSSLALTCHIQGNKDEFFNVCCKRLTQSYILYASSTKPMSNHKLISMLMQLCLKLCISF